MSYTRDVEGYCYQIRKIYPEPKPFELFVEKYQFPGRVVVATKILRKLFESGEEAVNYAASLGLKKDKLVVANYSARKTNLPHFRTCRLDYS